jgi:CBS domain-containing protein/rubredoxin
MRVNEIMTTDVVSVRAESTIESAARLLARHRISGLPVMNQDGKLVGLVTEYDLIAKQGATVADIMSHSVISVSPDTAVEEVAHLLANRRIRRVPVLDGDQLVGIVSRSDLVKQIAMRWVCPVCGEAVHAEEAPQRCPRCHAPQSAFTREVQLPGD